MHRGGRGYAVLVSSTPEHNTFYEELLDSTYKSVLRGFLKARVTSRNAYLQPFLDDFSFTYKQTVLETMQSTDYHTKESTIKSAGAVAIG